jgi:hypothetical protein
MAAGSYAGSGQYQELFQFQFWKNFNPLIMSGMNNEIWIISSEILLSSPHGGCLNSPQIP